MRYFSGEIAVAFALLVLLFVIFNPFGILMPGYAVMLLLVAAMVAFGAFSVLVWKERGGDERERLHRLLASRAAFLAGGILLLAGIAATELSGALDPWLVYALAAMIAAKVAALIYGKMKL